MTTFTRTLTQLALASALIATAAWAPSAMAKTATHPKHTVAKKHGAAAVQHPVSAQHAGLSGKKATAKPAHHSKPKARHHVAKKPTHHPVAKQPKTASASARKAHAAALHHHRQPKAPVHAQHPAKR